MATAYHINLVDPAFVQGEVQSGYSKYAYSLIDQRLLAPAWRWPGYVRQVCATTSYRSIIVSYHELLLELLLIDMHQNCTRTGYEVHACIASLSHLRMKILFHKLKSVIRFFMRKTSMFSVIYDILTSNYFQLWYMWPNLWKPNIMAYTKILSIYYKAL